MRALLQAVGALIAFLTMGTAAYAADDVSAKDAVRGWVLAHQAPIYQELDAFLRLPNDAADEAAILANARALKQMMETRGILSTILTAKGARPAVFGVLPADGPDADERPTIMFYAHYDGQPVDPTRWATPPYEPVLRTGTLEENAAILDASAIARFDDDWRVYARASSDDKSPIVAILAAVDALADLGITRKVNLKFFFEGEEEIGSPALATMLSVHKKKLDADLWLFGDGPIDPTGEFRLIYGVRGVTSVDVVVHGPSRPLHSGHFGNVAPNPGARLAHLITTMRDETGQILIDGVTKMAKPPIPEALKIVRARANEDKAIQKSIGIAAPEMPNKVYGEAILYPSLNVLGLDMGEVGDKAKNAIQAEARATLGFRMVPDQTLPELRRAFNAHVAAQGYHVLSAPPTAEDRAKYEKLIEIKWSEAGYSAAATPLNDPWATRLRTITERFAPGRVRIFPLLGGSLPLAHIRDTLGAPLIILPIVNPDNNQHAPNENLRLGQLWDGIALYASVIASSWEGVGEPSPVKKAEATGAPTGANSKVAQDD
ncbi:MAG: M20/M25/M40 family metallo-hydrolase [Pseudomonadota bacterium]